METFRWAFLGCGGIAHTTAKELIAAGNGEIVTVWNRTRQKAEDFAREFGGQVCDTALDAIRDARVEGVYIALTANLHEEYMHLCIENGKSVLCEKPFTVNASQASAVFEHGQRAGVYVCEAMWTWFNATARQVKYWVQSGALGKIHRVSCTYSFPMILSPYKKPRHTSPELIGGALLDTGVYGLRYCYELFGKPETIHCEGRVEGGIDLGEKITMEYDGFTASFLFSRDQNHGEDFVIEGEKGTIRIPMYHCARKATMTGQVSGKVKDKSSLFGTMFRTVGEEIRAGRTASAVITPESTVAVMEIMDICRAQMGLVYPCETE